MVADGAGDGAGPTVVVVGAASGAVVVGEFVSAGAEIQNNRQCVFLDQPTILSLT